MIGITVQGDPDHRQKTNAKTVGLAQQNSSLPRASKARQNPAPTEPNEKLDVLDVLKSALSEGMTLFLLSLPSNSNVISPVL